MLRIPILIICHHLSYFHHINQPITRPTNTIGAIIVAVVIIGLLVVAINAFFPTFFTDMFNGMKTRLNSNW